MWLRGSGGKAYFPTDDGILDLSGELFPPYSSVDVEGSPSAASAHQTSAVTLSATHTQPGSTTPSYSGFQSVTQQTSRKSSIGGFSLKVIQARITHISNKGRPNFKMEGQTFIELCEKTANVGYVLTQVQREFGSEYAVVTADGLEVKDSSGTQGLCQKCYQHTQYCMHYYVVHSQACHSYINFVCDYRDEILEGQLKKVLCCAR